MESREEKGKNGYLENIPQMGVSEESPSKSEVEGCSREENARN